MRPCLINDRLDVEKTWSSCRTCNFVPIATASLVVPMRQESNFLSLTKISRVTSTRRKLFRHSRAETTSSRPTSEQITLTSDLVDMASDKVVGVLGGGQLGRMLAEAANLLEIKVNFLDAAGSSAKQVSGHDGHVEGSFKDKDAIQKLAEKSDVITVEIEHVDTEMLKEVADTVDVQPSWQTIRTIQDKYVQKLHLEKNGVAAAQFQALSAPTLQEMDRVGTELGLPFMLKCRRDAYDGRGNFAVKTKTDFREALDVLSKNKDLYAEKWCNFKMELAVMVVKTKDNVLSFPTVETIHEDSICKLTYCPARGVSPEIDKKAQALARQAVGCFWGKGVFGVEMFLTRNNDLLINEIAPRPHNSGHYTIEGCPVSQYEAHLRAILDLPLQQEDLQLREPSIMLNILGGESPDSHLLIARAALRHRRTKIHLYGKGQARKGRKMGHITVCAPTMQEAEQIIQPMIDLVDEGKPQINRRGSVMYSTPQEKPTEKPLVAIVMGSDSDLPVLQPGLAILNKFSIPYTTRITSAHRTPSWMAEFASGAAASGLKVIIAAAGGAAHLPGMTAAYTSLPVIGVPVKPTIGDGMDSLLSICNMPRGVPVATVSINNSVNAALLAARIIGSADLKVRDVVEKYMKDSEKEVREKDLKLVEIGAEKYATEILKK
ncbi:phosphoribosylaminoimidazole carboxylase [Cercospora beticola]|uniref:Phosphoribosylaminoimidazole carboxylase n=2 Tax=Cercospora beticola TaxID=122368 RepID=A0A2G5HVD5_CERBT|nr:phosphoribosylaminoimidazole carboxylase [Cercospora beticola]PIA96202.1 phosphoribosylaminoimidazole carboxylase [Cercospora beticola]